LAIISLRAVDVPCSGASSPHDIHFKLKHSDSIAAILEGEKQFAEFYSMANDLPKIKNIILIDKIKLFSEKEDAPEWATPIVFKDGEEISKKFLAAIHYMILMRL
jgi:long-subunit acyl-CoA synthetase (AMP-forming)